MNSIVYNNKYITDVRVSIISGHVTDNIYRGTLKMRDMKLRDMKMRHQIAGVENARNAIV